MNPTVYVETSVVSYLTARPSRDVVVAAYQEVTRDWCRSAPARFALYASALVMAEARTGDPEAARARLEILRTLPLLDATGPAVELTGELLDRGAVPRNAAEDAAHIAVAAANGVDYLVTWNFRHIANATMRSGSKRFVGGQAMGRPSFAPPANLWRRAMREETQTDPIIDEIRAARDEHAARFNYDVKEIFRDIQAQQEASGREYVRLLPRRVASVQEDRPKA